MSAVGITAVTVVAGVTGVGGADARVGELSARIGPTRAESVDLADHQRGRHHPPAQTTSVQQARARPGAILRPEPHHRGSRPSRASGQPARRPSHHRHSDAVAGPDHRHPPATHGRLAENNARETVAHAESSQTNAPGQCLQWVRHLAGIPSGAATAATAWADATVKERRDPTPPPGAAVYWTGGSHGYGHVAISLGHGRVRSSDAGGTGQVATVRVGWISRNWGLRYAGWSNSINGFTIPGVPVA